MGLPTGTTSPSTDSRIFVGCGASRVITLGAGRTVEGKILAERYRLLQKLGEGGMGSVWRAEHLGLRTHVAVKLIDPDIIHSEDALRRFEREAQAAAAIRSVNIVQILDYGVDERLPYIAMELLEGETLASKLARVRRMQPADLGEVLHPVARALSRAHEKGIAHRDLKPSNIFIVREGQDEIVKLLDFGIAKRFGEFSELTDGFRTKSGLLIGTPHYVSPEQAMGKTDIDHRVDIWAFGVIAYQCLIGALPFEGGTLGSLLMAICHEPLPIPSARAAVPAGFDNWFARAVARDPQQRFDSILDAVTYLRVMCRLASSQPPPR